jgi:SAM-dependent methyltransferase
MNNASSRINEQKYVHNTYSLIAKSFNNTRYAHWNKVKEFIDGLPSGALLADSGCGNGKYANYRQDITWFGNDACPELVEYAKHKSRHCIVANCLNLPYRSGLFDAAISIAVLHHISDDVNRIAFIKELLRIVKPGGKILITVWAREQVIKDGWQEIHDGQGGQDNDFLIPWNNEYKRYYHLFTLEKVKQLCGGFKYTVEFENNNWCIVISS